jgi:hypothetical protein
MKVCIIISGSFSYMGRSVISPIISPIKTPIKTPERH